MISNHPIGSTYHLYIYIYIHCQLRDQKRYQSHLLKGTMETLFVSLRSHGAGLKKCRWLMQIELNYPIWQDSPLTQHRSLRIHVWYICLHLVDFYGKCRQIYHTWILRRCGKKAVGWKFGVFEVWGCFFQRVEPMLFFFLQFFRGLTVSYDSIFPIFARA